MDSIPERALLRAEEVDVFALSAAVDVEIARVLAPETGSLIVAGNVRKQANRIRHRFAADSPLEEAVSSELVSEAEIPC